MQRQPNDELYLKKIDFVFYNAEEIKEAVFELRQARRLEEAEVRNASYLSDPTAAEVIRKLEPIDAVEIKGYALPRPDEWLIVVEKTYNWCAQHGKHYLRAVQGRYSGEYYARTCAEAAITVDKFYKIIEKARNYAALQAAQRGLIFVE